MCMEMNFPHPKGQRGMKERRSDFAVLVAAAVARQMAGIARQSMVSGGNDAFTSSDPISARMGYFGSVSPHHGRGASGAFLPQEMFASPKVNKIKADVYPDALVNGKSTHLPVVSPEQPVAMRGMEN